MQKTSFRLSEDTLAALAEIADKCHNGNRTAALAEAVQRYRQAIFDQPAQPVGWVQTRVKEKTRCARCNSPIEGGPGFVLLTSDGRIDPKPHCSKCAK